MSTEKPFTLHLGDCRDVLRTLPENSIDAVITDPPYGLSFMGKGWDHGVPGEDFWREVYRVMKPGAHLIAYGGTRTIHRLTVGIEDAGFEIRDSLYWLYGSGFPKSHNVSKAIDAHLGLERPVIGTATSWNKPESSAGDTARMNASPGVYAVTGPASPEAAEWEGWGSALKPAVEPAVLARKPLSGTIAQNVLQWRTGGLNIDGCRIPTEEQYVSPGGQQQINNQVYGKGLGVGLPQNPAGRWPANIFLDETAAEMMDQQSAAYDPSGASRFFYITKAGAAEREIGLEGVEKIPSAAMQGNLVDGQRLSGKGEPIHTPLRANTHPTVKPLQLMQYMIRLITPPGGTVLDPFMGSGSTGAAAMMERCRFVGIDITEEYIEIARKRIQYWSNRSFTPIVAAPVNIPRSIIKPVPHSQQMLDLNLEE